jgi:translation initiation factor 4E
MNNQNLLENNWTLWFHNINNNDWSINSYDKVFRFNNIEDFITLFRKINNFSAGMFFLMKEDIEPIWENEHNKKGGYWSFKVLKKNINQIWYTLSSQIIGNNCLNNQDTHDLITGITLSPKINNCIIKIWFSNIQSKIDIFNIKYLEEILPGIDFKEARFVKHIK